MKHPISSQQPYKYIYVRSRVELPMLALCCAVKPREFVRHLLRYCIVLIEVIIVCIVISILYLLCHLYIVDKQLYQFFMLLLPLGDTNALEYTFIVETQRWTTLKYILSVIFYVTPVQLMRCGIG